MICFVGLKLPSAPSPSLPAVKILTYQGTCTISLYGSVSGLSNCIRSGPVLMYVLQCAKYESTEPRLRAGKCWVTFLGKERDFLFSKTSSPTLGPSQSPFNSCRTIFTRGYSDGQSCPHTCLCSAQTKGECRYTFPPPYPQCLYDVYSNNWWAGIATR